MQSLDRLNIRDDRDGVVIAVKVVPGASRGRIVGVLGDRLKITTSAAAEKGKANEAVAKALAKALGVGRRDVTLSAGRTSTRKEFRISGLTAEGTRALLKGVKPSSA